MNIYINIYVFKGNYKAAVLVFIQEKLANAVYIFLKSRLLNIYPLTTAIKH